MDYLPAMKIAQGEPFAYDFTVQGQSWTGWTGTATFKRAPKAVTRYEWDTLSQVDPILTVSVTGDATGLIQLGLTTAQASLLPALPRLGFFRQAVCEIAMTSGADAKTYQARVLVAAQI